MSVLWSVYYVEKVLNVKHQASIKLSSLDEFIGQNNEQTHPPSQKKIEDTEAKASTKQKAEATEETSQQILAPELRKSQKTFCKSPFYQCA